MKRAHRYSLYAVLVVVFFSGAAWLWFNYFATVPNEFGSTSKSVAMKIHGAAAMAALVLIGTLLTGHVKFAWRAKRNRGSGALFLSVFGILTLTGYGLYYAGGDILRAWASWIHLGVGLLLPFLLIVHVFLGKRTRPTLQQKHHHSPAKIDICKSSSI